MGDVISIANRDATILEKLLQTPSVIHSVCEWNDARYPQEPSHALSMSLLFEEFKELETAYSKGDKVAILDGLGDLFFVAIGVLWKTGLTASQITQLIDAVSSSNKAVPPVSVALHWYQEDVQNHVLCLLVLAVTTELEYLLESEQLAMDVYRAICISNNTKEVKKTAKEVKANIEKGLSYKPPTEMLKTILVRAGIEL